jgi:hypothetical protein
MFFALKTPKQTRYVSLKSLSLYLDEVHFSNIGFPDSYRLWGKGAFFKEESGQRNEKQRGS